METHIIRTESNSDDLAAPITKKKRATKTKKAGRAVDMEIQEIRQEAAAKVKELKRSRKSGGVLKNIIEKRITKLVAADVEALKSYLNGKAEEV